jgi:hypothetical protein
MKRFLIILPFLYILTGCTPDFTENNLIDQNEISLIWKGVVQVGFDQATGQLGYNDARHEYRVYNDKLSDWFTVRCSEEPAEEGQELSADVSWTGERNPKSFNGLSFTVKKINQEGLIWLWNEREKIGIIIKDIK